MIVIEVSGGLCHKPFNSYYVPRRTYKSLFIDVTYVTPCPTEFWGYDYLTKTFSPPPDGHSERYNPWYIRNKWNDIRNNRNMMLSFCDWTMLTDVPLTQHARQEWVKYRQELRDVPSVYKNIHPDLVILPVSPDKIAKQPTAISMMGVLKRIILRS